jgi:fermentation-respiration switch protein FrsA (DUF1100 family)
MNMQTETPRALKQELFIVPVAGHVDLYDQVNLISWDKLQSFFDQHLA